MATPFQIGNDTTLFVQTAAGAADALNVGAGASGVRYVEDVISGPIPRVAHIIPATAAAVLGVVVVGSDITVNLGTAAAGVANSTAAAVMAAINAHPAASALVTATLLGDGTGIAAAQAITALSGGTAPVFGQLLGQRDYSHSSSREGIDVSHKGNDHAQTVPGRQEGSISVTVLVTRPDAAEITQTALRKAFNDRLPVYVREVNTFPGAAANGSQNEVREAEGYVLDFSKEAGDNSESTFDVEVTLNGKLELVAA